MLVNEARSVSEALYRGLHLLRVNGIAKESRVGDVLVAPYPVLTVYKEPTNRVLFSPMRNANPFFHVMETLWMLAGRNDLPWLVRFNKRFASYSDDGGQTQPGAYGYRWRNYFGHDQLTDIILELKQNPETRRAVLAMWDGGARDTWAQGMSEDDPHYQPGDFFAAVGGSKDVPCNTHAYFDTIDGRLNMTVCCRSNDIIWGAYGANAVHFSFLLEYIALATGIPMGVYRQFSNNFHMYTSVVAKDNIRDFATDVQQSDKYLSRPTPNHVTLVATHPPLRKVSLVDNYDTFDAELVDFMREDFQHDEVCKYENQFFPKVAIPMYQAYMAFKAKRFDEALDAVGRIAAEDWRWACTEWLYRRKAAQEAKQLQEAGSGAA